MNREELDLLRWEDDGGAIYRPAKPHHPETERPTVASAAEEIARRKRKKCKEQLKRKT